MQSFDLNFGRPTVKLSLQFSNIKRRFNVHEPYQDELDKIKSGKGGDQDAAGHESERVR